MSFLLQLNFILLYLLLWHHSDYIYMLCYSQMVSLFGDFICCTKDFKATKGNSEFFHFSLDFFSDKENNFAILK